MILHVCKNIRVLWYACGTVSLLVKWNNAIIEKILKGMTLESNENMPAETKTAEVLNVSERDQPRSMSLQANAHQKQINYQMWTGKAQTS